MPTDTLEVPYPAGFEEAIHLMKSEMAQHIRLMAALEMFELGKVAAGKAAELAGMSRADFYKACRRNCVSAFNYPSDDVGRELRCDQAAFHKGSEVGRGGCGSPDQPLQAGHARYVDASGQRDDDPGRGTPEFLKA